MSKYPVPSGEGHYWAKLIHPSGVPENEIDSLRSTDWEVVAVYENGGDPADGDFYRAFVPGISATQALEDFIWGPRVADWPASNDRGYLSGRRHS